MFVPPLHERHSGAGVGGGLLPGDAVAVGAEVDGDEIEAVGAGEQSADAAADHGEVCGIDVDLKDTPLQPIAEFGQHVRDLGPGWCCRDVVGRQIPGHEVNPERGGIGSERQT